MRQFRLLAKRALIAAASAGLTILAACGSDHPESTDSAIPIYNTAASTVTVVLPQGTTVAPNQLTVIDSITKATPQASGSVHIDAYASSGSQLTAVLSPAGNPMLYGWLDANHSTIDSSTTAEVLAYFVLGGEFMLNDADRTELIAEIPGAGGFMALAQAVDSEIKANPDAFGQANPTLTAAMQAFFTAATSNSTASVSSQRHATPILDGLRIKAVSITPDTQSGIQVIQDPPFAVHLVNTYRRRATAYVDRVSHTVGFGAKAVETPDPAAITNFEVAPIIGLTGGVNGTISDIVNAYFGNQSTAYGPVSSPSGSTVSTPLVSNTDKTTYKVTVVGPGASNDAAIAALTAAQNSERIRISVVGFCNDLIVPFFGNVIFGSGQFPGAGRQPSATLSQFKAAFINNLSNDFFLALPTLGTLQDKITAGHYKDAMADIINTGLTGNAVQGLVEKAIQETYTGLALLGPASAFGPNGPSPLSVAMTGITRILGVAGAALQVFDTGVYAAQGANSDAVNTWTLSVVKQVVTLNPSASNIGVGGTVTFDAEVLGVEDPSTTYSYQWTSTALVGDLTEVGGGGRLHQTNYCSSSNKAQFVYETHAPDGTVDTVTVQAFSAPSCATASALGGAQATVTFMPNPNSVSVSPASSQTTPGSVITLAATLANAVTDPDAVITYQWTVAGNAGGTLTNPVTGTSSGSFESASATVSYTAAAGAVSPQQDTVTVTAYQGSKTNASLHNALGAPAVATISFGNPWVGTWVGNTVSTCGSYSGPQTFDITVIDATTLDFGPYQATYSGNSASVDGGAVVFTLDGNTIHGYEADSCQTGTYTRQ